jgi:hypothetical protein
MRGTPVFKGTRIPIDLVAGMLSQGATAREVLEGYPALNGQSIAIAPLYLRVFPRRGRPSRRLGRGNSRAAVDLAHAAGFEAIHVNHLGLSGRPDLGFSRTKHRGRIHVCDQ